MSVYDSGSPGEASPGDKTKKYDRQLRLWGDHGQVALEQAKVCLVNVTATGTEILKNLILPGIGAFTIVDNHLTTGEDAGNNFFLDSDSIDKPRAQVATELLQELNEDVNGDFVNESPENLLNNNPDFFKNFSVVIVTTLAENVLLRLAAHLWSINVPLLMCKSCGFIGYMRLVLKEHTIVESHPDSAIEDLRLDHPFASLIKFCDRQDMDAMSKKDHSHTPWLVVLYKYLQKWKAEHGGEAPKNYREKNQLKEIIRQGTRMSEERISEEEENFEEAMKHLNTSLVPTRVPGEVQRLFEDEKCLNVNSRSSSFWIILRAVKEFVHREGDGLLPLRGSIPDMTADSERYVKLQNVYKEQANHHIEIVSNYVQSILSSVGKHEDSINEQEIRLFCRNACFVRAIRGRSLAEEYDHHSAKVAELSTHLENTDEDDMVFYVMLRAVDRFHQEYYRYPGGDMDTMETDIPKLKTCLTKLLQETGVGQSVKDEYVLEFCRYGMSELHSVAAYIGGIAAQEVIKIVTGQFIPFNNTHIYNAMKQTSVTMEL